MAFKLFYFILVTVANYRAEGYPQSFLIIRFLILAYTISLQYQYTDKVKTLGWPNTHQIEIVCQF